MSQRVDFLTPRASLPPQSPPGLAGFEGRWPHSGSSTGPHGRSSRCGCGRDRCPPARRHPLGAISHWRGPFHFVSRTGRCVGSQEAPWLRRLSRPARRWCREQGEQGAVRPGGAREAGCSRTTPAAAAPSHVCGCCGDETSARPKPRLQNLDARPGGGAERPGSAFRLWKAFGVPRDELADGPESQPCPCCPQASAARSAWSTCPWIVPRLRPPHPRVFSKRRGSFPSEPRARAVISLRVQFIHGLSSRGVCEPQREGTASSSRTAASSALVAAPSHRGQPKRSDSCSPHEWRGAEPEPRHQQAWAPGGGAAG